jgi:RNA polymerase sigma factor (sigma-70 family)
VDPIDDHDLVLASQAGDEAALTKLIDLHAEAVQGFIFALLGDRNLVEDLAQDTFLRAFLAIKKYEFRAPFRSWLFRIAINLCRDQLRKRKVRKIMGSFHTAADEEETEYLDPQPDALENLEHKERSELVHEALAKLPDPLRQVLILRDLQEYSYEEMAQLLGWRMGTIKSRLFRARKELGQLLKSYMEEAT